MKKLIYLIGILLFYSCENYECKQCPAGDWKIEILQPPFEKTLEVYPTLDSLDITGSVDWMNPTQLRYVDADLWNLFDAYLIDSMIIYNSNSILAHERGPAGCCGSWYIFTTDSNSFDKNFIEEKGSCLINPNWKTYPNKPIPTQ